MLGITQIQNYSYNSRSKIIAIDLDLEILFKQLKTKNDSVSENFPDFKVYTINAMLTHLQILVIRPSIINFR